LPYFAPDYQIPKEEGLKTPDMLDAMLDDKLKALFVMGEDLAHIHPNQNKINKALDNLEVLITQELFMTQIAKKSDIVFGVKSAYEKTGVYVNAMRRLHLAQPLVKNDLPDDWEVLRDIENKINGEFLYSSSEDVWNETRENLPYRYGGASYQKLTKHRSKGLQWPVARTDTPRLHLETFSTSDGMGNFKYNGYKLREQIEALKEKTLEDKFYLTTGRILIHYNNLAQTGQSEKLMSKHSEDTVLVSIEDKERLNSCEYIVLTSKYGKTTKLPVKYTKTVKTGTLFTSFHHAKSHINYLFGDESDVNTKTARFKSVEVTIEQI
jgi:formate dehydrogenase major subunit